jgi:hypothetical protein
VDEALSSRLAEDLRKSLLASEERVKSLMAERDLLLRRMAEEDERRRLFFAEEGKKETARAALADEARAALAQERARRELAEKAAAESARTLSTLAGELARAVQDRDAALARVATSDQERSRLLDAVRRKEELVALLSATLKGVAPTG